MKKILAFSICVVMCCGLCACKSGYISETASSYTSSFSQNASLESDTASEAVSSKKEEHTHSYSSATCTSPAKCSCGATKGSALGHSYSSATCTSPAKCSCGSTKGSALGHSFSNGKCVRCGAQDPNYKKDNTQEILSEIERYPTYLKLEGNILLTEVARYKVVDTITGLGIVKDMQDTVHELSGYLQKIINACEGNKKLYPLATSCDIDIPVFLGDADSYVSDVKLFASRCTRIEMIYNACKAS